MVIGGNCNRGRDHCGSGQQGAGSRRPTLCIPVRSHLKVRCMGEAGRKGKRNMGDERKARGGRWKGRPKGSSSILFMESLCTYPSVPQPQEVAARRYVVGFESTRGRLPDPTLTTLSTTPPPPWWKAGADYFMFNLVSRALLVFVRPDVSVTERTEWMAVFVVTSLVQPSSLSLPSPHLSYDTSKLALVQERLHSHIAESCRSIPVALRSLVPRSSPSGHMATFRTLTCGAA
ncbi:hypothetical protein E2C01_023591 [Portunus trituberculatus]|uniref:Uncharacterized protein n=1 Tax=Portunus trituberculatus TaxID=210409 RepID=A0A5B7E8E3_PORTR|nr:hypothetical protein [Portunus trituberculatus]